MPEKRYDLEQQKQIARMSLEGSICHSNRGVQYDSEDFCVLIKSLHSLNLS